MKNFDTPFMFCMHVLRRSSGRCLKIASVTMEGPHEQTVAKCSWIFVQIRISNELNKITLKCKVHQTAEFVRNLLILPKISVGQN